ncbi:DUF6011 domain-containing protein [Kribbella sp. NPDC004875]|uniref:DUF6011 domain-containing protein n=1 Tax=Kribbella sp. NPDC004875 TaxID=3364107 RepID=UPI0036A0DCAB
MRLARRLGTMHKLHPRVVMAVLDQASELISEGFMVRRRPAKRQQPAPSGAAARKDWPGLTSEIRYFLSEIQTDAVYLQVAGTLGGIVLRLRLDFVDGARKHPIWLACLVEGEVIRDELLAESPLVLGRNWSLPLVRPAPDSSPPLVAVWRTSSPGEAADTVRSVLEGRLGIAAERVHLTRDECTPRELDRRVTGQAVVQRLRRSGGRKGVVRRSCDRCGQPLSDPESVRLGIGPECRSYYSRQILDAVRRPSADVRRPGSKSQVTWLSAVRSKWWPPHGAPIKSA